MGLKRPDEGRGPQPRRGGAAAVPTRLDGRLPQLSLLLFSLIWSMPSVATARTFTNSTSKASSSIPYSSASINTTITVTPIPTSELPAGFGALTATWEASPACTTEPTSFNSIGDVRGRRWGRLEGSSSFSSCAFKDAAGQPAFSWETAVRCLAAPSVFAATADDKGRLWGSQFGSTCAFKAADSDRPVFDFLTAPACTSHPEPVTCESDAAGRLWGWESGQECAYKDSTNTPLQLPAGTADLSAVQPVAPAEMVARGAVPTAASLTWRASPACSVPPSKLVSTMDGRGRLWGWENTSSCAFKDASDTAVYDWTTAPRCLGEAADDGNSRADGEGRLWGWEAGNTCAFKDLKQRPLRAWATATRCPSAPELSTAVPDATGRLWGWLDDSIDLSCAFKDDHGAPLSFEPLPIATAAPTPTPSPSAAASFPTASGSIDATAAELPAEPPVQVFNAGALADGAAAAAEQQQSLGLSDPNIAEEAVRSASASTAATTPITAPHPISDTAAPPNSTTVHDRAPSSAAAGGGRRSLEVLPLKPAASSARAAITPTATTTTVAGRLQSTSATRALQHQQHAQRSRLASRMAFHNGHSPLHRPSLLDIAQQQAQTQATAPHGGLGRRLQQDSAASYPSCRNLPAPVGASQDSFGRIWSAENGVSCVYRTADSRPAGLWDVVPQCAADPTDATIRSRDAADRLWGWENNRSCGFRDADGKPRTRGSTAASPSRIPTASAALSFSSDISDPWFSAPTCVAEPSPDNSKADDKGRAWGWENSGSCAFRTAGSGLKSAPTQAVAPLSASTSPASVFVASSQPSDFSAGGDVRTSPSCSGWPTMDTSQPDAVGFLWGWQDGKGCVFRGSDGKPLYYAALITGDWSAQPGYTAKSSSGGSSWYDAPRCSQPPTWAAKPDSEGRLWGYEAGQGCVFRDARGYPLFYSDLQNGNVAEYYNRGSKWDNAGRCPDAPSWSTARADNYGRLWGWDSTTQSNCGYKDVGGQPVYPPKSQ